MPQKFGSTSYHLRPWRADTGCAWWLLCHPSPPVSSATHQLLRESSRVSNLRDPQMWVAEFTNQVTCNPTVTLREIPQSTHDHPPTASKPKPSKVTGNQCHRFSQR